MFEQFWAVYPRKVGKKMAEKAFNRLKPENKIKALNSISAHVSYWEAAGTEKEFIPHASTWLNGERWEDEIEAPKPKEQAWWTSEKGMIEKGKTLGLTPGIGESGDQIKSRITQRIRA